LDKKNRNRKFEEILQEAIDEALSSLGESVRKSIYLHLEQQFLIPQEEIACRIGDFSDALERIFGIGARYIELLIMRNLFLKVSFSYRWDGPKWLVPNLTFKEYIELVRVGFEDEARTETFEVIVDAGEKQQQRK